MKYTGDSLLGVSFSVKTPKPLDNRTVVNNTTELYSIPSDIAYEGMSVSNLEDGYIYMLVDKTNINNSDGWVASYKALQLVSCTEAEYNEWKKNTTEEGNAVDSEKPYLHNDTYYYIYEDSIENKDTYYVNQEQYQRVWNFASSKADLSSFNALKKTVEDNNNNVTSNYLSKEEATNTISNTNGNTVNIKADGVFYDTEKLAKSSEVPKWQLVSQEEYNQLETDGTLLDDVYYLTYGKNKDDSGFVTADLLDRQIKSIMQGVTKLTDSATLQDCIAKINEIIDKFKV